ncbi:hypothetical protein GCM10009118_11590 [Wandonia haliotis]|uniref:SiaC family regulatory phosphoprotein domain-containing protein n=1 Tax=Wandonia haliotis TaxID=574963 RepID=A0ABP3XZE4_9FLAO
MEKLFVEATTKTPFISFDEASGIMTIKGRSIPKDAETFWNPVLNWFALYMRTPAQRTTIRIDLEYFNISSSKSLLLLLYKLNEMKTQGFEAVVEWYYNTEDIDMYEVGQDYAFMVKVPFEFKKQDQGALAMVV